MIETGDLVLCLDATENESLEHGKVYKVTWSAPDSEGVILDLPKEMHNGFFKYRFVKFRGTELEKVIYGVDENES